MNISDLLSLDYNNIEDAPLLKNIIQSYHIHLDQIVKQMQQLSRIRDKKKTQNQTIVQKMYSIEQQNQRKIKQYDQQIQQATKNHEIKVAQIAEKHEFLLKNSEIRHHQTLDALQDKIKKLRSQFSEQKRQNIDDQQESYLHEIKQKSSSLITQQYEHHDNMNKHELKYIQQNRQLFTKNRNLIKELKRDVRMEAGRIVYKQKYQNQDKNYELKIKLLDLQDEVTRLRKQRNQIVKSRNQQKINVSLNEEQIQQYKAVGSIQKSKIKMYNDKIETTKKTITSEISKLENKIKEKKNKWESELKSSRLRYFNLQKQKEQMKINLERYKILGQTILMQREEVEQFFLMAIESCKKQMDQAGGMLDNAEKQYGQKVDIDELLPKDKHRIVTNLYTKLALAPTK